METIFVSIYFDARSKVFRRDTKVQQWQIKPTRTRKRYRTIFLCKVRVLILPLLLGKLGFQGWRLPYRDRSLYRSHSERSEWCDLPIKSSSSLFEVRQVRSRPDICYFFPEIREIELTSRYEDAEKDCSTVLSLSIQNVKAYFRRGQARVSLGRFIEAQRGVFSIFLDLCICWVTSRFYGSSETRTW